MSPSVESDLSFITMPSVTLPVSSLRPYINRALIFINRAKLGLNPAFGCLYLEADKAYVYNGESGAIISMPFSVSEPTLLMPFDLAKVLDAAREESEAKLDFDYKGLYCRVTTEQISIKIRLIDPKQVTKPVIPQTEPVAVDNIAERVRNAIFCASPDASLPKLQGVFLSEKSFCATDQRGVWREAGTSDKQFSVTKLLADQLGRLSVEPTSVGLSDGQLVFSYPDMIVYGSRLADDTKFPDVDSLLENHIGPMTDESVVRYDRDSLTQRLEALMSLPQHEGAIKMKCEKGVLTLLNAVKDGDETEGVITLDVASTADFRDVEVNGELLRNGIQRFHQFAVKSDGKRLLFWNDTQQYCMTRRAVQ